ncbi:hypothetical protein [Streptomyces catenulae]|uniref:Translation initiation factor IF-2 n=1 Tax=Streptomyces catenulae TaxID=66875 RepID=A0ABV2Z669_9ACTN|nr:hypothetical protein [Streptomyces catenulae]
MEPEESRRRGDAPSADGEATAVEAAGGEAPAAPPRRGTARPPRTDGATVPVLSADTTPAPGPAARRMPGTDGRTAAAGETDAAADTGKRTAGKTASATAATGATASEAAPDTLVASGGRVSRPMVAAAGIAGVLLLCSPFLISQLTGRHGDAAKPPAAASEYDGQGRGAGVVPGADQPQGHQAPQDGGASGGSGGQGGAPADAATTYTGTAGPGCTDKSTGYKEHGTYADGDAGWTTHKGGWAKDGCDGSFVSVPMAGDKGDDGNYTLWTFTTGPVKSGSCQVRAFIPGDDDVKHVGGHPTRYSVFASAAGTGKALGDFTVDQTKKRGDWAPGGTFPITDGHLSVKLHTQGTDFGSGFDGAHHAASAVTVRCTG